MTTNEAGQNSQPLGAPAPGYWSEDARAGLVLFTAALDLLERAGTYEKALRWLTLAKQALAQASAHRTLQLPGDPEPPAQTGEPPPNTATG